ncbi:MAG TPA: FHA domain-containing protein [Haliangium sp.]|nr:FHA domain-containing protein [Haliangium sp.]
MGILVHRHGGQPLTLAAHCLVGRSSSCTIRLNEAWISAEHARLTWRHQRWEVRDLGSRNGTFVNGVQVLHGRTVALTAGDEIAFGDEASSYRLIDASPPIALARRLDTGVTLLSQGNMLVFPSEDTPLVSVIEDASGRWIAESEGEIRTVRDGETVTVAGVPYMLHLPVQHASTQTRRKSATRVADIELHFRVSRNEEQVEVAVIARNEASLIPPRAHHYTFLTLARARLQDEGSATTPEPLRGWLRVDELCRMLAADENRLNVDICRIRHEIAALDVQDAAIIVERRRGRVRVGAKRITIERRE